MEQGISPEFTIFSDTNQSLA